MAAVIAGLAITAPIMNTTKQFANAAMKQMDITVSDTITATIDRSKGKNHVVVPVDITINEASASGYELYMYGGELTDGTNTISLVSADGSKITEGTWGVVIDTDSEPAIDDEVWNQIGTSSSPKMVSSGTDEIPAGTTGRIYYGVAIDDDTPAGTYTTTVGFQLKHDVDLTLGEAFEDAGVEQIPVGPASYYPIQAMTTEICENTSVVPSTLEVVDIRDNNIYTIGKLADNRCWLLDNLLLDLTAEGASTNITAENTNADAASLDALFGRANRDYYSNPEGNLSTSGVTSSWNRDSDSDPIINLDSKDLTLADIADPEDTLAAANDWKFGILYNFCAASAGSFCYGLGTAAGYVDDIAGTAIDAPQDICPTGWRLPTGYTYDATDRPDGGEWKNLYESYSDFTTFRTNFRFALSGYYYNGRGGLGSSADVWSSTDYTDFSIYIFATNTSNAYLEVAADRGAGKAIRCIAK